MSYNYSRMYKDEPTAASVSQEEYTNPNWQPNSAVSMNDVPPSGGWQPNSQVSMNDVPPSGTNGWQPNSQISMLDVPEGNFETTSEDAANFYAQQGNNPQAPTATQADPAAGDITDSLNVSGAVDDATVQGAVNGNQPNRPQVRGLSGAISSTPGSALPDDGGDTQRIQQLVYNTSQIQNSAYDTGYQRRAVYDFRTDEGRNSAKTDALLTFGLGFLLSDGNLGQATMAAFHNYATHEDRSFRDQQWDALLEEGFQPASVEDYIKTGDRARLIQNKRKFDTDAEGNVWSVNENNHNDRYIVRNDGITMWDANRNPYKVKNINGQRVAVDSSGNVVEGVKLYDDKGLKHLENQQNLSFKYAELGMKKEEHAAKMRLLSGAGGAGAGGDTQYRENEQGVVEKQVVDKNGIVSWKTLTSAELKQYQAGKNRYQPGQGIADFNNNPDLVLEKDGETKALGYVSSLTKPLEFLQSSITNKTNAGESVLNYGEGIVPNAFATQNLQDIEHYRRQTLNALSRFYSGAALSFDEEVFYKNYWPRPGDSEESKLNKFNNLKRFAEAQANAAGAAKPYAMNDINAAIEAGSVVKEGTSNARSTTVMPSASRQGQSNYPATNTRVSRGGIEWSKP